MNTRSLMGVASVLCVVCAGSLAQAPKPSPPTAMAPVVATAGEGLQRLPLPLPVLLASRSPGYADVRLVGPGGQALPMAWAQAPLQGPADTRAADVPRLVWPGTGAANTAGEQTRIRVDAHGAVVEVQTTTRTTGTQAPTSAAPRWLLDLSQAHQPTERLERVTLDWTPHPGGLSSPVQVEWSDDAIRWEGATTAALLALPGEQGASISLKDIDWPAAAPAAPRYLRLTFDTPITLTGSQTRWTRAPRAAPLTSEVFSFTQEPGSDSSTPAWSVDLGGRLPVSRLELPDMAPNTVSALRLEQRDSPAEAWRPVADFVVWRLQRQGTEQRSLAIALPASSARHWRLVGDPRTSRLGQQALPVRLGWEPPQIVFAAAGAQGIELQVGFVPAHDTALPLSTLIPAYQPGAEHRLPVATLGALVSIRQRPPTLTERLMSPSPGQKRQWLLWGVLAAVVAGLGVMAVRLAGELRRSSPPADGPH